MFSKRMINIAFVSYNDFSEAAPGNTHNLEVLKRLAEYESINKIYILGFNLGSLNNRKFEKVELKAVKLMPFKGIQGVLSVLLKLWSLSKNKKLDMIYERDSQHSLGIGTRLGKMFKIPVISEVNTNPSVEITLGNPWYKPFSGLINRLELSSLNKSSHIIAVSTGIKDRLVKSGIVPDKISVLMNGCDVNLFKPEPKSNDNPTVCFIGSLVPWQGLEYLIRAMKQVVEQVPKTRLLIIGDGAQRKELERLVNSLNLTDSVSFIGKVTHEKVPDYVNSSDMCVLFRTGFDEGFSPLKLFEYLACNKPVLASRSKGFEFIEQSNFGILASPTATEEVADKIVYMLKNKECFSKGREFVLKNHSWDQVSRETFEIIERLAK